MKVKIALVITLVWFGCMSVRAKVLSIEQAIEMALKNSADVKITLADLDAQKNKQISSWLDLGPRINASYNHIFYDSKVSIPMNGQEILMRDDVTKMGSLTVTQPLTGLFALWQLASLEGKRKDLKETTWKLSRAQSAFKIAELYLRAQQSARMWEISQASIDASEAQQKDGAAMFRVGRIHKGDFLKLELSLSQARANEAKARAAKDIARFVLLESIGLEHEEDLALTPLEPQEIALTKVPTLEEGLRSAVAHRFEIKQAQQGEEIAAIARRATLAKFFPSVNFFAQVDHNFGHVGFGGAKDTKMLGFNLTWEFFNSGSHLFQFREASFAMAKARYQRASVSQLIRTDLMQARASLQAAYEGLAFAEKAVEQANEAYRIEKIEFSLGKSSATSLVLAETAKTTAAGSLVSFFTDLKIQYLKLQQALGEVRPAL